MELTEKMEQAGFAALDEYEAMRAAKVFPRLSLIAHLWSRMTEAAPKRAALADWSHIPDDIYVTSATEVEGIGYEVECCSVPMMRVPEVRYTRSAVSASDISEILGALGPFAEQADEYDARYGDPAADDDQTDWPSFQVADFRRARDARDRIASALGATPHDSTPDGEDSSHDLEEHDCGEDTCVCTDQF
jgi:hypothetical protein